MNARDRAIADIEKYFTSCLAAWWSFSKGKDNYSDEQLERLADDPHSLVTLFYKGVPLGKGITKAREEKGISLSDMASRVGISETILTEYENGKRFYIPLNVAEKIRKEIGCTRDYLVSFYEEEDENQNKRRGGKTRNTRTKPKAMGGSG